MGWHGSPPKTRSWEPAGLTSIPRGKSSGLRLVLAEKGNNEVAVLGIQLIEGREQRFPGYRAFIQSLKLTGNQSNNSVWKKRGARLVPFKDGQKLIPKIPRNPQKAPVQTVQSTCSRLTRRLVGNQGRKWRTIANSSNIQTAISSTNLATTTVGSRLSDIRRTEANNFTPNIYYSHYLYEKRIYSVIDECLNHFWIFLMHIKNSKN